MSTPRPPLTVQHRGRAIGALLGLAVGDAIGTTLEFKQRDSQSTLTDMIKGGAFGLKPGEWTYDTTMALCLAGSLIARGGILDSVDRCSASLTGIGTARTA